MTARPWRVLFSGRNRGACNMAVDAAVLAAVEEGVSPPTLRVYGWDPYCVSLGYFQNPAEELDAEALGARGWDFVLRPTGGRAVLHAEEITYSLTARRDEASWCATLAESHERISRAWSQALGAFSLGVEAGQTTWRPQRGSASPPCFASTSRAELAHAGRKVVGSAQRRTRGAFLQHGSIPLTPAHERLLEVLRLGPEERDAQRQALRGHAVSLGEISALPADFEAWIRSLAPAVCAALGVACETGELSGEEIRCAGELQAAHFSRQADFFAPIRLETSPAHA